MSNTASGSVGSVAQYSAAADQLEPAEPVGASGRPRRYSSVTSSGATSPARAPSSIDMLHSVIRCSMDSARTAPPRYSTTWPRPPEVPTWAINVSTRSFAVASSVRRPVIVTAIVFGRYCGSVCVASTCSTSLVPIPNASAPNAPCVLVWLSPHTIVMPGWVSPRSGAMTCTIPWRSAPSRCSGIPNSAQFARSARSAPRLIGSVTVSVSVGTLWSSVASVRSGRRTVRPDRRNPSKACGLETSCTRCRSM